MTINSCPDVRVFDINGRVEAVKGRDGEFASTHQGEEGTGEAGSHRGIKQDLRIKFTQEGLN